MRKTNVGVKLLLAKMKRWEKIGRSQLCMGDCYGEGRISMLKECIEELEGVIK